MKQQYSWLLLSSCTAIYVWCFVNSMHHSAYMQHVSKTLMNSQSPCVPGQWWVVDMENFVVYFYFYVSGCHCYFLCSHGSKLSIDCDRMPFSVASLLSFCVVISILVLLPRRRCFALSYCAGWKGLHAKSQCFQITNCKCYLYFKKFTEITFEFDLL